MVIKTSPPNAWQSLWRVALGHSSQAISVDISPAIPLRHLSHKFAPSVWKKPAKCHSPPDALKNYSNVHLNFFFLISLFELCFLSDDIVGKQSCQNWQAGHLVISLSCSRLSPPTKTAAADAAKYLEMDPSERRWLTCLCAPTATLHCVPVVVMLTVVICTRS